MALQIPLVFAKKIDGLIADPGVVSVSEEQRFRSIVELAEKSDKNHFDPSGRTFCSTCLLRRPIRFDILNCMQLEYQTSPAFKWLKCWKMLSIYVTEKGSNGKLRLLMEQDL